MPVKDLREWIARVDEIGELTRVDGVHPDYELGGIADLFQWEMGNPALLFDQIQGFRPGYRVLANVLTPDASRLIHSSLSLKQRLAPIDGERDRSALVLEQLRVAARLPVGSKRYRNTEHGGLEHGMQSGAMICTAHERDVSQRVQIREHADPIHHDERRDTAVLEL